MRKLLLALTLAVPLAYADINGSVTFGSSVVDAQHSAPDGYILYLVDTDGSHVIATGAIAPLHFTLPGDPVTAAFMLQSHNAAGSSYTPTIYWQANSPDPIELILPPGLPINVKISFGDQ